MKVKFSSGSKEVQSYRNWLMLCNDHIHKYKTAEEVVSLGSSLNLVIILCPYKNTLQEFLRFRFVNDLNS
ncbi:PREDICTED: PRUPE_1G012600 [Prunus dulcis]|uniref:PREDICTED: PRUPE_1G012600 n=1 Tax=Prunus dulcis TaxID=3755 RepID=A0A5E4F529_PRUDU|nr:PREDICTED: PRUPE_1G012600 [Prunus dulcis]